MLTFLKLLKMFSCKTLKSPLSKSLYIFLVNKAETSLQKMFLNNETFFSSFF